MTEEERGQLEAAVRTHLRPSQYSREIALHKNLRDAVFSVLEGFTIPHDVRKILETAYYAPQSTGQRKPLPEKILHLLAAKHGFQLLAGGDFKNLMAFGRDIEEKHEIKEK